MDIIARLSFYGALVLSPMLFFGAMWRLRKLCLESRILASTFFSVALFASLLILAWNILFRDGMGPDAVETHGTEALARCWVGVTVAFVVGAVLAGCGAVLARPQINRETL